MINTENLQQIFHTHFGGIGTTFFAPGRINLIGEHTDYNGGFVFPGAIDMGISASIRPNGTDVVNLIAIDLNEKCSFNIHDNEGPTSTTFRYVYGVVREMLASGSSIQGFDAVYGGDVPLGAGMSSSAALECCFAFALNKLFNGTLDLMQMARIGQATEHKYVGVKCGIMDQFASMHGRDKALMRLDCKSGEYNYFPWNPIDYRLVLINSCVKHELVGSPYNERRGSCEHVAKLAGVDTLRDCSWDILERIKPQLSDKDFRRARYVLGETDRVMAVSDSLENNDYEQVGRQMYLTHKGLKEDYEVSCEEIDFLVDIAKESGVTGSRIMGGGFGGCTINLVNIKLYDNFIATARERFKQQFGIDCKPIPVVIGAGAKMI